MPPPKNAPPGRPPKFTEESAPVTVTLPLSTLEALRAIDKDRAKAIVKCVQAAHGGTDKPSGKPLEIIKAFDNLGLIVIGSCPALRKIPRLKLIEIAPCRFLLVVLAGYGTHDLELDLIDLIEDLAPEETQERALLNELRRALSHHRKQTSIASGEIVLIDVS